MSLETISKSDRAALNDLIGRAMLYDDLCNKLLKQHTRMEALEEFDLSLNLWLRIMSLGDIPNIYDLAAQLVMLICPSETLM
jgi:bacterioferritin (cytochrome b1)